MSLLAELQAAGLNAKPWPGWETRGGAWTTGQPVGIMHHHTAAPVPFPVSRLDGSVDGRIKCNINTKPDGTVYLVAYEACNYSSGGGSATVLAEVQAGRPPAANARDRGLSDTVNGNPRFFNFENDHLGHGEPIPQVQHDAIVEATRVVMAHFGLTAGNVISHAEWTARKSDPYWNNDRRSITTIRKLLETPMADHNHNPMPDTLPRGWADGTWEAWVERSGTKDSSRGDTFYREDLGWVYAKVIKPLEDRLAMLEQRPAVPGIVTEADVQAIAEAVVNDAQVVARG